MASLSGSVPVTNVGRGPALDVTAAWREDKPTAKAAAILRPDEEAVITLTFPEGPPAFGAR
jgi:hypothetical protein